MNKYYMKFFAGLLLFGSNGIIAGQIDMPSHVIVFYRTALGALTLCLIIFTSRENFHLPENKKHFALNILSGMCMGAGWLTLYEAYLEIGVGLSTIIYYLGPALVVAISPILFRESLTRKKIICFALVLAGAMIMNVSELGHGGSVKGLIYSLISALLFTGMLVSNKKATSIQGVKNSFIQTVASFIPPAIYLMAQGGFVLPASGQEAFWILFLGIANTGFGMYFYFSSIGKLSVQTVSVCGYIEPLFAVVLSVIILGESLLALQLLGMVLILGGAFVMEVNPALPRLHRYQESWSRHQK